MERSLLPIPSREPVSGGRSACAALAFLNATAVCALGRYGCRRHASTKGFNRGEEPLRSTRQGETPSLTGES